MSSLLRSMIHPTLVQNLLDCFYKAADVPVAMIDEDGQVIAQAGFQMKQSVESGERLCQVPVVAEGQTAAALVAPERGIKELEPALRSFADVLRSLAEAERGKLSARKQLDDLRRLNWYNRTLIESTMDAILVLDTQGKILDANVANQKMSGWSIQELKGTYLQDYFPNAEQIAEGIQHILKIGSIDNLEFEMKHKDGYAVPVLYSASVFHDEQGNLMGIIASGRDIAQRKQAEEELSKREQYQLLAAHSTDIIARISPDCICRYVSPAISRVLGYEPEEVIGKSILRLYHPQDLVNVKKILRQSMQDAEETFVSSSRFRCKDGTYVWLETNGRAIFDKDTGKFVEFHSSSRNITGRKWAEEELQRSAGEISKLYEEAPCGYYTLNTNGYFTRVNRTFCTLTGYSREELVGSMRAGDLLPPASFAVLKAHHQEFISTGHLREVEVEFCCKDGSLLPVLLSGSIVVDEKGNYIASNTMIFDIKERRRAQLALRKSESQFRLLAENATDVIARNDEYGVLLYVSPACKRIGGYEPHELVGRKIIDFVHPDDLEMYRHKKLEIYRKVCFSTVTCRFRKKDGQYVWLEVRIRSIADPESGRIVELQSSVRDISERKAMEEELLAYREKLDMLLNNVDAAIFQMDQGSSVEIAAGKAMAKLMTQPAQEASQALLRLLDSTQKNRATVERAQRGETVAGEMQLEDAVFSAVLSPFLGRDGSQNGVIGLLVDVTAEKKAQRELLAEKERLRVTLQSIGDGVITTDGDGRVTLMNAVAEELTGWRRADAVGRGLGEVYCVLDESTGKKRMNRVAKALCIGGMSMPVGNLVLVAHDGARRYIAESFAPISEAGQTIGEVVVFRDVTEAKKREREVAYLSYHDQLTGMYNRTFFEEEAARLDTPRMMPLSIIMGDVNGLKLTNDVFGHRQGDSLLKQIADKIRENCRAEDIVARIGGDEFCILLPRTSEKTANEICRRISAACNDGMDCGNSKLSISLGCATKIRRHQVVAEIIKAAEDSMYRSKLLESRSQHSFIISSIRATLFEKSYETEQHAARLIELSKAVGSEMGLTNDMLNELELFAMLHDIGKIAIDSRILTKPDKLTEQEWTEMKRHPEIGFRIAQSSPELTHIAEYILYHHERWDGYGYPEGLAGMQIPQLARILSVVDAYDAMTQDRVYRRALSRETAVHELERNRGTQFDPEVIDAFLEVIGRQSSEERSEVKGA